MIKNNEEIDLTDSNKSGSEPENEYSSDSEYEYEYYFPNRKIDRSIMRENIRNSLRNSYDNNNYDDYDNYENIFPNYTNLDNISYKLETNTKKKIITLSRNTTKEQFKLNNNNLELLQNINIQETNIELKPIIKEDNILIIDENIINNEPEIVKENKKMTINEELEYRYQLVKSFTRKK
jgi:hypothetical protein